MALKSPGLLISAFILTVNTYGQTENSVDVTPHWKNNETHSVKIESTTTDINKGTTQDY